MEPARDLRLTDAMAIEFPHRAGLSRRGTRPPQALPILPGMSQSGENPFAQDLALELGEDRRFFPFRELLTPSNSKTQPLIANRRSSTRRLDDQQGVTSLGGAHSGSLSLRIVYPYKGSVTCN